MYLKFLHFMLSIITSMILITIFGTQVSYAGCSKDMDKGVQEIMEKNRQANRIPGIEVSINCPGEATSHDYVSGTTLINGNVPVQADNLFQIGSETKSFISVILLQLEAQGLISIEDKIGKWLPDIPADWKDITIRQLLNHTSGIYNYTDVMAEMAQQDKHFDFNIQWTASQLINLVVNKPPYFAPGMGWHYSNTNYVLAGLIIESVTGKPVDEEIKARLTESLPLSNTYYLPSVYSEQIFQRMAHGYSEVGIFSDEPKDITETNTSWASTAGAIVATSHDTAIWFKNLTKGALLPAKQMNELMTLVDLFNGQALPNSSYQPGYGLGVIHDYDGFGEESWWHSGGTLGYSAMMVWLKCSDVVITTHINHITKTLDIYALTKDLATYIQKSDVSKQCSIKINPNKRNQTESQIISKTIF